MLVDLWVDKYKPETLDTYIWQSPTFRKEVEGWIAQGSTDNLILLGPPGTGKTSLARVLMNELLVDPSDILRLNAPKDVNIDMMRDQVHAFITTGGWGGMKYIILEEADGATPKALETIKSDMEEYSTNVRWILTANALNRIIPPIQDRCLIIEITKPDRELFVTRMVEILELENIPLESEEDYDIFSKIIDTNYPSIRKTLRDFQRFTQTGKLQDPNKSDDLTASDWKYRMIELFRMGNLTETRKFICANCPSGEMEDVYRWMYNNHEIFPDPERAIVIIADGLYKHSFVADPEINLAATLIKLHDIT